MKMDSFIPGITYIPSTTKIIDKKDIDTVVDAALDGHFTAGRYADLFEKSIPAYFGKKTKGVLVNSGSSANLVAISSLGLKPGDEVITAGLGFPTTVNPILQCGAIPVFVDVNLKTLNVEPDAVMEAKTDKTKAIVLAHTLGIPFRADLLDQFCDDENLGFVEDCCDALGSTIQGKPVGSFSDFATCSFYPAHHITMGEGGVVLPAHGRLRMVAQSFRDWGRDCWCDPGKDNTCGKRFSGEYDHKYTYSRIGYNLKVTDLQAALGYSQLDHIEQFVSARKSNWNKLSTGFQSSPFLREHLKLMEPEPDLSPSWFGFPLLCNRSINRNLLVQYLEDHQVGTRMVFAGNITKQPAYKNSKYRIAGHLKNCDEIMKRAFWIGVHPGLTDSMIHYMLDQLEAGAKTCLL